LIDKESNIDQRLNKLIHIESNKYENIFKDLYAITSKCNIFEKIMLFEEVSTSYVRIKKIIKSFENSKKDNVTIFIDNLKYNMFDSSFSELFNTSFYFLENKLIKSTDPNNLGVLLSQYGYKFLNIFYKNNFKKKFLFKNKKNIKNKKNKNILFIAVDNEVNLYLKTYLPIFQYLKDNNINYKIISFNIHATEFLKKNYLPFIELEELSILKKLKKLYYNIKFQQLFKFNIKMNTKDDLLNILFKKSLHSSNFPKIVEQILFLQKLFKNYVSDIFFIPDGTLLAYVSSILKNDVTNSYSIISAGIGNNYRSLVNYHAETIFCQGNESKKILQKKFSSKWRSNSLYL